MTNQLTGDRFLLTDTMDALDCLRLYIGMPYGLAEDDARRRDQVQAVRSQLKVHKEHPESVGCLEGSNGLLARFQLQLIGERYELDASEIECVRDVRESERRL